MTGDSLNRGLRGFRGVGDYGVGCGHRPLVAFASPLGWSEGGLRRWHPVQFAL